MKKMLSVALILLVGFGSAGQALADRGHHHRDVGVGVIIGPYWSPWYYPPPPPYYPPPYYYPPTVVIEHSTPPVYIEKAPATEPQPSAGYWYYCQSPSGYYPDVRECPGGWLKVLPRQDSRK